MFKVEIKPGVGFSKPFGTKIEAMIFIRDFDDMCRQLGITPFRCEIIKICEEVKEDACDEEPGTSDEEAIGRRVREVSEGGVQPTN